MAVFGPDLLGFWDSGAVYLSGDLGVRSTRFWCCGRDLWLVFSSGLALVFGVGLSVFWVPMGVVCMMGKVRERAEERVTEL